MHMHKRQNATRREFLKTSAAGGAALVISFCLPGSLARAGAAAADPASFTPNAFIRIDADGGVTLWAARSEMGQGVRTSLPMILAEELDADWSRVRVLPADLDPAKYGDQGTGGSDSVRGSWDPLRHAGATARDMLLTAAAQSWGVDKSACHTEKGQVIQAASGRRLNYGELVAAASKLPVPQNVPPKGAEEYHLLGTRVHRTDVPMKVNGSGVFGIDVRVPGMLYAVIERCPVFGGAVKSFHVDKAKAVPGVRHVVKLPRVELMIPFEGKPGGAGHQNYFAGGVAVVADSTWAAIQGRRALEVEWNEGPASSESSGKLRETFQSLAAAPGVPMRNDGDFEKAVAGAAKKIEAVYEVPFLAHATMEPMNCTAHATANGCEVWAPIQMPEGGAASVAHALGIKQEDVRMHITLLGGGFGRRLNQDYAVEAALASKAVGAPVKVTWTREDDICHDYYRPASYHALAAGIDAGGAPVAWRHRVISPSISTYYNGANISDGEASELNRTDFPAFFIPNFRLEWKLAPTSVPRGWWRSVENSGNFFVIDSFFDELAAAAGKDPLAYRLNVFGEPRKIKAGDGQLDVGRRRAVIELAASKAGWGKPLPRGHGRGLSAYYGYGSFVAQVAEVSVSPSGAVRVHWVTCAIDCGLAINPDGVKAQMESAIVFGLSAALKGNITIDNGRVQQSNFSDYPVLRMNEMPSIDVHVMPSHESPGGCGEPGVPPIAPAVANAIFAATGKRIRRLPIRAEDLR
jgi:isoquinoline 1-oxidoreductase beta subunit